MKIIKKYKTYLIGTAITVLLCATGFYFWQIHQKKPVITKKQDPMPIKVITLHTQALPINAKATGYLQAIEQTTITPRISGYIETIPFKAGATVKKGNLIFQLDNIKEKNALAAAKANDVLSKLQYQRNKKLLQKGFITHDIYYTSKVTMKQNDAALKTAQINLADKTVKAPFSGMLGAINASIGDYVSPGKALTTLVDNQDLRVIYTLPVKDLSFIKLGQAVTITSDTTQNKMTGHVSFISPAIDKDTQTILLHAKFSNNDKYFKPGEFVKISQHIGTNQKALLVPEQSVIAGLNGYSVFVAKNNKAIKTSVKISQRYNGKFVISEGLKPKAQLIVAGQDQIHDGQSLIIK